MRGVWKELVCAGCLQRVRDGKRGRVGWGGWRLGAGRLGCYLTSLKLVGTENSKF